MELSTASLKRWTQELGIGTLVMINQGTTMTQMIIHLNSERQRSLDAGELKILAMVQ